MNSTKPQCPNQCNAFISKQDAENHPNPIIYSDSSSWDSDPPSSNSCNSESTIDHNLYNTESQTDLQNMYNSNSFKKAAAALKTIKNANDSNSDLEDPNVIQDKTGIRIRLHEYANNSATGTDSLSDYSESDLKDLLKNRKDEGEGETSDESNSDFEDFDQVDHGNRFYSHPKKKKNVSSDGSRTNTSTSVDAEEIGTYLADSDLDDVLSDLQKVDKDNILVDVKNDIKTETADADDDKYNRGSDSSSDSETEQERWDRIIRAVKRMKMLLIKYPKFASRAGNNNTLHSMMDTLESKQDQKITALDLKMVEEQMEAFKKTLLSGIDEDLAKWRAQRRYTKHNLTRIFSIFVLVAACTSFFAKFIYDYDD